MSLSSRIFRHRSDNSSRDNSSRDYGLIETRSATPSAPIYLRFYEHPNGTLYELSRGMYRGYKILEKFVPWCVA